ncbi:hypothetical protein ABZ860_13290 [Microbispora sp. NPDC046973]|uniref:hypothetical protein n=1 Tax=Microbispora sp. NPDC046973 TaxID=3155022 RepID=UPI003403EE7C
MPHQVAVMIHAPLDQDRVTDLRKRLGDISRAGMAGPPFHFGRMPGVHFARFFVLPADRDPSGAPLPAELVYLGEVDAPARRHLRTLLDVAADGLDEVFGHCPGYPGAAAPRGERLRWLRRHSAPADAFYVNTVGRTVAQIRAEAELRQVIQDYLDRRGSWAEVPPQRARQAIQAHVRSRPELAWAFRPPPGPALWWRSREVLHRLGVPLLLLPALPILAVAVPVWLVLLRLHEIRDVPDTERPGHDRLLELADCEDDAAQNPFTAVGFVKPGTLRRLTTRVVFAAIDYAVRHHYNHADLAGVKTIHFARWVSLDGRRVLFASDYDGSLESYMDDFIDKLAWGLNAAFSNGVGYPRTRWLVTGGARDEQAFKYYLRRHQIPTAAWYSAYDTLTARNIDRNARIRAGLRGDMTPDEAEGWLRLL